MTLILLTLALVACRGEPESAVDVPPTATALPDVVGMPDAPIYDVPMVLEDQDGARIGLDTFRGHPTVLSMFYTICKAACPMLISRIREVESQLPPTARDELRVLMVSFDPEHDTPAQLRSLVEEQHLDQSRWTLARPTEPDVRLLSALLGIKVNRLENGDYNHSSVLVLVDGNGRPAARLGSLSDDPAPFVAAATALAAASP